MSDSSPTWIGLDVGGAHLKVVHQEGAVRSHPFELWKRSDELGATLRSLVASFPHFDKVALTMTAELCDCYPTKRDGVNAVLDAVVYAVNERPVSVWGIDGRFHELPGIRERPGLAAASNWLALATLAARLVPLGPSILIDIGSTTADLIPIGDGRVAARGRTDTERLQTGELVYAGTRRTPLCAVASSLPYRNVETGLAAELFATTHDVYLTLQEIPPDPTDRATADGRPATIEAARDRLARMIGADREEFSSADAEAFARSVDLALLDRLAVTALRACEETIGAPRSAIVAGSGEYLARRLAERILPADSKIIELTKAWGPVVSAAAPAFAVVVLARESDGGGP